MEGHVDAADRSQGGEQPSGDCRRDKDGDFGLVGLVSQEVFLESSMETLHRAMEIANMPPSLDTSKLLTREAVRWLDAIKNSFRVIKLAGAVTIGKPIGNRG